MGTQREADPDHSSQPLKKKRKLKRLMTAKKINISQVQVENMLRNLNCKGMDRHSHDVQDTIEEVAGSSNSFSSEVTESEQEEPDKESLSLDADSDELLRRFEEKEREKEKQLLKLKRGAFHQPKNAKLLSYKRFQRGTVKKMQQEFGGKTPKISQSSNIKSPQCTVSNNQEFKKAKKQSSISLQSFNNEDQQ